MNYYTTIQLSKSIKEFKARIIIEPEFCLELFEYATIRLLSHKYAYYVIGKPYLNDDSYDSEEKGWYVMGRALGLLKEDETTPCIGFNENHKLASRAIQLSLKLSK